MTDIYRFDVKKQCWTKRKDYTLYMSFKFSGNDFYLTYNNGWYYVCTYFDDDSRRIYSVYRQKETVNGQKCAPGEVVSEFRKQYLKNKITNKIINDFLSDPLNFTNS